MVEKKYPTFESLGGSTALIRLTVLPEDKNWTAFNPSIMLSNEGEYWMAVRSSNYVLLTNGSPVLTTEHKIRNKMFLVRLKEGTWEFDEDTLKEIDIKPLRFGVKRNIEDPRLFWDGKNYCISATFLEVDSPTPRICKVTLDSLENAKPIHFEMYPSSTGNMEKNWMPIHKISHQANSTVDFIHSPSLLFTIPDEFKLIEAPKVSKPFRGGTQVLPTESGGIGVIHELYYIRQPVMNPVTFAPIQSHRCYTHRFVSYDKDFKIDKVSPRFVFVSQGIEFASGITEHDGNYVISFGRADRATFMATINKQLVFDMLEDVDG
jgi:hypothetical protein